MRRPILIGAAIIAIVALALGLTLGLHSNGSATSATLNVLPFPGTPDASPQSQITFPSLAPADLSKVTVKGSKSGVHAGQLSALPDDRGTAFVADKPFTEGEAVSVQVELSSKMAASAAGASSAKRLSFAFTIAKAPPNPTASSTTTTAKPATPSATQTPPAATQAANQPATQSFHSAPDLKPPVVTVNTPDADPNSGYMFVDAQFAAQNGPMILDGKGNLVWYEPMPAPQWAMDFKVESYLGKPVLTWWQGQVVGSGHGSGEGVILDSSYKQIATVHPGEGYDADLHEFMISSQDTALMTIYQPVQADLSSIGGPKNGTVLDGIVQEVDIETGKILWEWHALGHVPLSASYAGTPQAGVPYDFFHINSIEETPDNNLIISARNTWAIYKVNRSTGAIMWQLGGKGGSYTMGPGVQFEWQHDARLQPDGTVTVFDNASSPKEESESRALRITLDPTAQTATLVSAVLHAPGLLAGSQGNNQVLPNGNIFVGWGDQGYFSEFSPDGKMIFDASFPRPAQTYRAYRSNWVGLPATPPSVSVSGAGSGSVTVYASWNGATGVASWRLLAGSSPDKLSPVASATAKATGFETTIAAPTTKPYLAVQALDSSGKVMGTSAAVAG